MVLERDAYPGGTLTYLRRLNVEKMTESHIFAHISYSIPDSLEMLIINTDDSDGNNRINLRI